QTAAQRPGHPRPGAGRPLCGAGNRPASGADRGGEGGLPESGQSVQLRSPQGRQSMSSELTGVVLDDYLEITLSELCEACGASAEHIRMLVAEGVIEPRGPGPED